MNINNEELHAVINFTMRNSNNSTKYNIVLEEMDNDFKRMCTIVLFFFISLK